MNKNVFTSVLVIGGLVVVYFLVVKPKTFNKKKAIDTIIDKGYYSSDRSNLESFDEAFIIEWGKAAKNDSEIFIYEGKVFQTKGGRAKR